MASTKESLRQMLRRLVVDEGLDIEAATDKALKVTPRAALVALVRPVVRDEARRVAREEARRVEDAAFSHPPTPVDAMPNHLPLGDGTIRLTAPDARQALVASQFVLPDGTWVTWGSATAEDHLARAGWQRDQAASQITDAVRHETAAKLITERGVTCLDDIADWSDLLGDAA